MGKGLIPIDGSAEYPTTQFWWRVGVMIGLTVAVAYKLGVLPDVKGVLMWLLSN